MPPFLRKTGLGWVTAEYGMLPRATTTRNRREATAGKQSGRTQEIQRLIGRSLRAGVDRVALGERQITVDCDVLQADGGTRCAAITGGWVALRLAVNKLLKARRHQVRPADRACGGGQLRHLWRRAGARPRLCRGQRRRDGRQLRDDRRSRPDRGAGQRRGRDLHAARSSVALLDLAEKGVAALVRGAEGGGGVTRRLRRSRGWWSRRTTPASSRRSPTLLAPYPVEVVSAGALGLPEPEETEDDASSATRGSRRMPRRRRAGCRRSPTTAASRSTRSAARPGVHTADWAATPHGPRFRAGDDPDLGRAGGGASALSRGRRGFAAPWCWPGPTATTRCSRARSRGSASGRCAATRAMATTRCSSPTATPSPSARWIAGRRTASAIAATPSRKLVAACFG